MRAHELLMYTSGVLNPNTDWVCTGELVGDDDDDETLPPASLPAPATRKASGKAAGNNILPGFCSLSPV